MAQIRLTVNRPGLRTLLNIPGVGAVLIPAAERVAAAARAGAPVASGAHRDSIHLEQGRTDRVVVRVVADSDHSAFVEAKTGNLAKALDAAAGA